MGKITFADLEAENKEMRNYAFLDYPDGYKPTPQYDTHNDFNKPDESEDLIEGGGDSVDDIEEGGLDPDQQVALTEMCEFLDNPNEQIHILVGWAGSGKTTVVKAFSALAKLKGFNIYMTATTNKAAKVMHGMNPTEGAGTIHSLMKLRLKDDYNTGKQVLVASGRYDAKDENSNKTLDEPYCIITDEVSMMNSELFDYLLNNITGKLILIGDSKQLPPVGYDESPVFAKGVPTSKLTTIKRQKGGNPIITLATAFREGMDTGIVPFIKNNLKGTDGVRVVDRFEFRRLIVSAFGSQSYKNFKGSDYAKVLAWRNKTVIEYNRLIRRNAFNFESDLPMPGEVYVCNSAIVRKVENEDTVVFKNEDSVTIIKADQVEHIHGVACFKLQVEEDPGDFYMILDQNQYKLQRENLANIAKNIGYELDRMKDINSVEYRDKKKAKTKAWFNFFNISKELSDIRPQYAVTIHKSQGSGYNVAFIDYGDVMMNRNFNEMMRLMYVAITRCKIQAIVTW